MTELTLPHYLPPSPRLPPPWAASQLYKRIFQVSLVLWLLCLALLTAIHRFKDEGEQFDGTITAIKEIEGTGSRVRAFFSYRDKAGDEQSNSEELSSSYIKKHQLAPGSPVKIIVLLGVSPYIKGSVDESGSLFGFVYGIFLISSVVSYFFARSQIRRRKILIEGQLAPGKISRISMKKTKGGPEYIFQYQFEAPGGPHFGMDKIFIGAPNPEAILELDHAPTYGGVVYVAYDPKQPTNNAIYLFEERDQPLRQEAEQRSLQTPPAPLPEALQASTPRPLPSVVPSIKTEFSQGDLFIYGLLVGLPFLFFIPGLVGLGDGLAMMLSGAIFVLLFWPLAFWGYYSAIVKKQRLLRFGAPFAAKVLCSRWVQISTTRKALSITFEGQGPNGPIRGKERIPEARLALYGESPSEGDTIFFTYNPDNFRERALWGFGRLL